MGDGFPTGARVAVDEIRRRFSEFERVRVWPEWCSPGLWAPGHIGATPVGGFVDPDSIPISDSLKGRLKAWQGQFDRQSPPDRWMTEAERCEFAAEGLNIAAGLSQELGPGYVIEYELREENLLFVDGACAAVFLRPPAPADP